MRKYFNLQILLNENNKEQSSCAELRSLYTFIKSKDAKIEKVILLPTDTADSYVCSKIISNWKNIRSNK